MNFVYYPLINSETQEENQVLEILVLDGPRSAVRHRRADMLAALLFIDGEHKLQPESMNELLHESVQLFFQTQGSVTRAMQSACDLVNKKLLEWNIEHAYEGAHVIGSLNLTVMHNGCLFFGHYGRTVSIRISQERYESFGIASGIIEEIGQVKRIQARFYQCDMNAGDLVILCANPPQSWTANNLAGSSSLSMNSVQQRLLNQVTGRLDALVIRCVNGEGKAIPGSWSEKAGEDVGTPQSKSRSSEVKESEKYEDNYIHKDVITEDEILAEKTLIKSADYVDELARAEKFSEAKDQDEIPISVGETEEPSTNDSHVYKSHTKVGPVNPFLLSMARFWMNSKMLISKIRIGVNRLQNRFLKKKTASITEATPILHLLLTFLIPAILIILSLSVYSRTGKAEQYADYFNQAQEKFSLAEKEKDGLKKHAYWANTMELVERAEEFNITRDSRLLYEQAQFLMDEMDLAARLDFRPALTSFFPQGVIISRIKSSYSGVYLLDETSGSILRIFLNAKGFYEIDGDFNCAPGTYGLETVNKLVDFITLPANDENYRVMGIDDKGNLLYCRTDGRTDSRTLAAPDGGWGQISALGYDQDVLYVLDSKNSAIWMYAGKNPKKPDVATATGIVFADSPKMFFDKEIPDLRGALDLAINQQELLVLHEDGHMSLCRYSSQKEVRMTECQDPASYTDNRLGRDNKKPWIFMDVIFTMMQDTKLPNLSIFVLETSEPSIYQFSFQLNLERTLRIMPNKNYPVPDNAPSGFGVTPEMEIFLAFENRLYIAPMR